MARSAIVMMGGRQYTLQALPIRQSAEWRSRLQGPFARLTRILRNVGTIELTDGNDLSALIEAVNETLIGSVDMVLDLLFAYSPALAADRERIANEAYDDEAIRALVEILRLAYPFGELRALVSGSATTPMPTM